MSFLRSSASNNRGLRSGTSYFRNPFHSISSSNCGSALSRQSSKRIAITAIDEEDFEDDECSPQQRQKEIDDLTRVNNELAVENAQLVKDNKELNKTLQEERDEGITLDAALDVVVNAVLVEARSKDTLIPLNAAKKYRPDTTAAHRDRIWVERVPDAIGKLFSRLFPKVAYKRVPMEIEEEENAEEVDSDASDTSADEFLESQSHDQAAAIAHLLAHNTEGELHLERTRSFQHTAHEISGSSLLCNLVGGVSAGAYTSRSLNDQRREYAVEFIQTCTEVVGPDDGYATTDNIGDYMAVRGNSLVDFEGSSTVTFAAHVTAPDEERRTRHMLDPKSNPDTWTKEEDIVMNPSLYKHVNLKKLMILIIKQHHSMPCMVYFHRPPRWHSNTEQIRSHDIQNSNVLLCHRSHLLALVPNSGYSHNNK